ncbi:MAG: IS66 family insertion sequence element accessory protein TnpB [Planctomycetes bacterium]|nr:IS66 family insertion sequence element accessory protein TnpB [Planctomycetota bacterium]
MLSLPPSVIIFLARNNTDMRKQIDSLAALVAHVLEEDPMSGHLFVFCNRAQMFATRGEPKSTDRAG